MKPVVETLNADACRGYLAEGGIGRVAVTFEALPVIHSVLFALHDEHVVIRVPERSVLRRAVVGAVVAFNADRFDEGHGAGWSVLVQGVGEAVTDTNLLASLRALPLPSWSREPEGDSFMRVPTTRMSGTLVREPVLSLLPQGEGDLREPQGQFESSTGV